MQPIDCLRVANDDADTHLFAQHVTDELKDGAPEKCGKFSTKLGVIGGQHLLAFERWEVSTALGALVGVSEARYLTSPSGDRLTDRSAGGVGCMQEMPRESAPNLQVVCHKFGPFGRGRGSLGQGGLRTNQDQFSHGSLLVPKP